MRDGDPRVADHAGERSEAHDLRALPLRDARRPGEPLVGEALGAVHHLPGRGAERDEVSLDPLPRRRRTTTRDCRDPEGRDAGHERLDQRVGQPTGPAEAGAVVDLADVQGVNHEGELVDLRGSRLQVAHRGLPLQLGDHVDVGVLGRPHFGIRSRRGEHGLYRGSREARDRALGLQGRHQRDHAQRPAAAQFLEVVGTCRVGDDDLSLQIAGSRVPNQGQIARQQLGPAEKGARATGAVRPRRPPEALHGQMAQPAQRCGSHGGQTRRASDTGKSRHAEKQCRIGVVQLRGSHRERVRQPAVIQTRNHQRSFFREDARLHLLGEHHAPALESRADPAAVDDGCGLGQFEQPATDLVEQGLGTQLQANRNPDEGDDGNSAVVRDEQLLGAPEISSATQVLKLDGLAQDLQTRRELGVPGVDYEDLLHGSVRCSGTSPARRANVRGRLLPKRVSA